MRLSCGVIFPYPQHSIARAPALPALEAVRKRSLAAWQHTPLNAHWSIWEHRAARLKKGVNILGWHQLWVKSYIWPHGLQAKMINPRILTKVFRAWARAPSKSEDEHENLVLKAMYLRQILALNTLDSWGMYPNSISTVAIPADHFVFLDEARTFRQTVEAVSMLKQAKSGELTWVKYRAEPHYSPQCRLHVVIEM